MCLLSNKMKITVHPEKLENFSREQAGFYLKYASSVFRTLKKPSYQRFLQWMLRRENIEEHTIRDVQVRILPFRRKNGNGLAGNCDTNNGKIRIYPRTRKSCRKLVHELGKRGAISYVKIRARAALIHELLHLKYSSNEAKVRELTRKYYVILTRNQPAHNSRLSSILDRMFKPRTVGSAVCTLNRPNAGLQISSGDVR